MHAGSSRAIWSCVLRFPDWLLVVFVKIVALAPWLVAGCCLCDFHSLLSLLPSIVTIVNWNCP